MNVVRKFFKGIGSYFSNLFTSKKVILANQEAIQKLETLDNQIIHTKMKELDKDIADLAKDLKQIIEMEKINQEFLLYLCTTNEELLNTIGEGEIAIISHADDSEETIEDELASPWAPNKKGNLLN
jgi:hypothetical protein